MGIRDQIHESDAYQAQVQEKRTQGEGEARTQTRQQPQRGGVGPIIQWEKTDVDFWMQVAQTVLLFLIWQELRRGP